MPTPLQARERSICTPFQIDETGGVRYVSSADQMASQEIQAVLLTALGERVMRSGLGSPFPTQVFETVNTNDTALIVSEMIDMLTSTCRYSTIQSLDVDVETLGVFAVTVYYVPLSFNVVLHTTVPFHVIDSVSSGVF